MVHVQLRRDSCNGFTVFFSDSQLGTDHMELFFRSPHSLKQLTQKIQQDLHILSGEGVLRQGYSLTIPEACRLKIIKQGDILSKHLVSDYFSFVLASELGKKQIICCQAHSLRGVITLYPRMMDELEAEAVPLCIGGYLGISRQIGYTLFLTISLQLKWKRRTCVTQNF